jgi:hypothetical protein
MENQSTGITCKTFADRLYKCHYFKEKESYMKGVRLLFEKILNRYKIEKRPLIELYAEELSTRSFTGPRRIPADERREFRDLCTNCIIKLSNLFESYNIDTINDPYSYKWTIKGYMSGILHGIKDYNLWLSFENASLVQKDLDFVVLNSYLYNVTHEIANDALVMSVPTDVFFIVPYNERDYTIKRGFLTTTKRNAIRKRGEYCIRCSNNCNPSWINGLDRLRGIV